MKTRGFVGGLEGAKPRGSCHVMGMKYHSPDMWSFRGVPMDPGGRAGLWETGASGSHTLKGTRT